MKYLCMENKCPFDGTKPFVLSIPQEVCVDKHNIATLFCPHCGSNLKEKESICAKNI
jgi:hypothetical protein